MGVNGKNKGNSFERKIANIFSERFKEYTKLDHSFRRNPDSGSFFGNTNESRIQNYDTDFAVFGDLICPRKFKFSIECKHYKSPPLFKNVMDQEITDWDIWLGQAQRDSQNSKKKMCLIIKYNNVEEIVITDIKIDELQYSFVYKDNFYVYKFKDFIKLHETFFFD